MSTALISLTYTMDDGNNYNDTYTRPGNVIVSDHSCYFHADDCPDTVTRHALAHAYGESSVASECGNYTEITDVINSRQDYQFYCRHDRKEFAYRFKEYNPNDTQKAYPFFTNRTITAAYGQCFEYREVGNATDVTIGRMNGLNFTYTNSSITGSIEIPFSSLGREATTYVYRDNNPPADATTYSCGDRCLKMWAYKNPGKKETPMFYECPITVSLVINAIQSAHDVPDGVAKLAAASIALQGRFRDTENPIFTQYQFYAGG